MSVRSGQSITTDFTTRNFSSGAGVNADSLPTGTLVVNGTDNAATVTITNVVTGRYKAQVTLPTLAVGDVVALVIAATVSSVSDSAKVWEDTKDVVIDSAGSVDANAVKVGPTGSGAAQTARDLGASVLVGDKTGFSITQSFPANFAALMITVGGAVTAGTVSDKTGYSISGTKTTLDALNDVSLAAISSQVTSDHGSGSYQTAVGFALATGVVVTATGLDAVLVDGKTLPSALKYIAASVAGKVSGAGSGTEVFLGLDGATTRLTITVDASGNRTGVVYG